VRRVITASVRLEAILVLVVVSGVTRERVSALECGSLLPLCNSALPIERGSVKKRRQAVALQNKKLTRFFTAN